ncbi:MAG: response regulator transcription factor [Bdellovibrionaceae bacterium]|nr:response regulator transcription factor [Pseudobdellovibrionaceae bacterium]
MSRKEIALITAVLLGILILIGADLVSDYDEGSSFAHIATEALLAALASFGFIIMFRALFKKNHALSFSQEQIFQKEKDAEKWRIESQKYMQGLSTAIDAQLDRWQLSPSEKEVALFLLKGLSLKEIAQLRGTSDHTIRVQTVAIYSKSGLSGRTELAAFFLEDLLVPQGPLKDSPLIN